MSRERRAYSTEFKLDAVRLITEQGYTVIQVGRALDICETVIRRWFNQYKKEQGGITPQNKALTPEQQRIQELEAQVNRLEREKAILKKASALLIADEIKHTL